MKKQLLKKIIVFCTVLLLAACGNSPANHNETVSSDSASIENAMADEPTVAADVEKDSNTTTATVSIWGIEYCISLTELRLSYMELTDPELEPLRYMENLIRLQGTFQG